MCAKYTPRSLIRRAENSRATQPTDEPEPCRVTPYEEKKRRTIIERMMRIIPDLRESEVRRMLTIPTRTSFRANPLRTVSGDEVPTRLEALGIPFERYDWIPDAFYLCREEDRAALIKSDLFCAGKIYVQNPASYLPVLALNAQKGEKILDMCAAPGGKAAHIAALTRNDCSLIVNDKIGGRVTKLKSVLELLGVHVEDVLQEPAEYLSRRFALETFDKILLDAQCTGEGMINFDNPLAMENWSTQRVEQYSYLQQRMLVSGFRLLKRGGTLVYSTCTFSPEENEKPISFLLDKFSDAHVAALDFSRVTATVRPGLSKWNGQCFHGGLQLAVRILPDGYLKGFFVCRIMRR